MPEQSRTDTNAKLAADRLGATFASFLRNVGDESELRDAICTFVDAAKAANESVEHVIIDVKRIARESELRPTTYFHRSGQPWTSRDDLIALAVTLCIKWYYQSHIDAAAHSVTKEPAATTEGPLPEITRPNAVVRVSRSIEMLVAYHRLLAKHDEAVAKYDEAMERTAALRAETTFTAAIRTSDRLEREDLRTAIQDRVRELRGTAFSPADVIVAIKNIVTDAVYRSGMDEPADFLQREALEWALEVLAVA